MNLSYGTETLRNGEDTDDISIDFSAHSISSGVHDSITAETERSKNWVQRLRGRMAKPHSSDNGSGNVVVDIDSRLLPLSHQPSTSVPASSPRKAIAGIMTVKTLGDSLYGYSRVSKMRRLRRKVTIKFKHPSAIASASASSPVCATMDPSIGGNTKTNFESESISISASSCFNSASSNTLDDICIGFHKVYIREYEVVPGCSPSTSCGPPLELGWRHSEQRTLDFERYEHIRHGNRRIKMEMRMPKGVRKDLLLLHGSTKKMIRQASKSSQRPW